MNKKFIFFLIILSFFFSILFSTPLAYAADPVVTQSYELNTPIGGIKEFNVSQGSNDILGKYVKAWYGFLLGIVGILAAVVIIFAGVRWMISRGNSSETGQAKEMMVSAISGLVLALLAYTILYLINPTLVVIKMPALDPLYSEATEGSAGALREGARERADCPQTSQSCRNSTTGVLDFGNVPPKAPTIPADIEAIITRVAGTDNNMRAMLRAICMAESGCNPNTRSSSAGAIGLMQIMPSTGARLNYTPEQLRDPETSIRGAAALITEGRAKGYTPPQIAAYYNGGSGAVAASRDCPGVQAYQCCTNPGCLTQTQDYVPKVMSYYNNN